MPSWRDHFSLLARYNVWATERLLNAHVRALSDADYRRDAGLFFKSVHGTLNHLRVAEQLLWYPRFARGVSPKHALDEEAEADREQLATVLLWGARAWQPLVQSWDETRFDGTLEYVSTKGVPQSLPFAATLAHVFNHGTHHRGQISAAITAMGHACPELDLVWMLQAEAKARSKAKS
jgi:uncharacterized damage-inducible protein DinB